MTPVPRIGRVLDAVGLLVFLGGGAVYARAWLGFQGIDEFERPEHGTVMAATELADGFRRMEHVGVVIMLVGIGVFTAAWWIAGRIRSSPTAPAG